MKKLFAAISLSVGLGVVFSGCSKKDNSQSNGTNSSSAPTLSGPPVELKVKWTVGKKYLQHLEMNQDSKMNEGGRPMEEVMSMASDYSISATKELPGGGCNLEIEFLVQKLDTSLGAQKMISFDSSTDPANDGRNPIAPALRKMIGRHIEYEVDANGRIQNVLGIDEMVEQMGGNTPQGAMIKSMYNADSLKLYADFGRGLPDHAVRIGESWPLKLDMPMGQNGTISLDLTYTFKGWDQHSGRKCAQLDYAGTLSTKANGTNIMSFSIENGIMSGTTWFDPETGLVVETTSNQNMDMKISPEPNQTITSVLLHKTDLKLVDITDIK